MKAELPYLCGQCGKQNMIDLMRLGSRSVNRIMTAQGFVCVKCNAWNIFFYNTPSLRAAMEKLERMDEKRKDFRFHFGKVMRKAEGVQEQGGIFNARK